MVVMAHPSAFFSVHVRRVHKLHGPLIELGFTWDIYRKYMSCGQKMVLCMSRIWLLHTIPDHPEMQGIVG